MIKIGVQILGGKEVEWEDNNVVDLTFVVFQLLKHVQLFVTPWTAACQASLSFVISWIGSNSHPLSQWCHTIISSSVSPFSSCPQSFPASVSFLISQLFASGDQSIGASALVLPMNIQDWFPLGWTGWISLQSSGLSRGFSSITVWKHWFFSAQPSLRSTSHIRTWLLEKFREDQKLSDSGLTDVERWGRSTD